MNDHFRINGSPTVDGYYTTYAPDEVTIDSSEDEGGGGGGGSSDFSTATVTIRHTGSFDEEIGVPRFYGWLLLGSGEDSYTSYTASYDIAEDEGLSVVLYKGSAYVEILPETAFNAVGEGDVTIDGSLGCEITGDCIITVSPRA